MRSLSMISVSRHLRCAVFFVLVVLCGLATSSVRAADNLDAAVQSVTKQLLESPNVVKLKGETLVIAAFDATRDVDTDIPMQLQEKLTSSLTNAALFTVVNRSQLSAALHEVQLSQQGMGDPKLQKELGKWVGANYILLGSIGVKNTRITVEARIVNIETQVNIAAASYEPGRGKSAGVTRPRIAIVDFDVPADAIRMPNDVDIAQLRTGVSDNLTDMLSTSLVQCGSFTVIERTQLHSILSEHRLGATGVLDPETATEIGNVLGVDYIVGGKVTEFGTDAKSVHTSYFNVNRQTGRVVTDIRMIDVRTAKILVSLTGTGEESKSGFALADSTFSSHDWSNNLMGKAMRKATDSVVAQLKQRFPMQAPVLYVFPDNKSVILDLGKFTGVKVGDHFDLFHIENVLDANGSPIYENRMKVGMIELVDVQDERCKGCFSPCTAQAMPQMGDLAVVAKNDIADRHSSDVHPKPVEPSTGHDHVISFDDY